VGWGLRFKAAQITGISVAAGVTVGEVALPLNAAREAAEKATRLVNVDVVR